MAVYVLLVILVTVQNGYHEKLIRISDLQFTQARLYITVRISNLVIVRPFCIDDINHVFPIPSSSSIARCAARCALRRLSITRIRALWLGTHSPPPPPARLTWA